MAQYQQVTRGKIRHPEAVEYGGIFPIYFAPITLTGTIAITTLQELKPIGINIKILCLALAWKAGFGSAHTVTANVGFGTTAISGPAPPDNSLNGVVPPTVAVAGQSLFNAAQSFSVGTTFGSARFYPTETAAPDQFDAIFPPGALANYVSVTAGGDSTTLYMALWCRPVDINPPQPQNAAWAPSATTL